MIHAENLHKNFGNVHAVNNVSFNVSKGEVVGLLGPNGAGKTTTMRIITGYFVADGGKVSVDGTQVTGNSIATREKIGYLPENAPIYGDLEVSEYLKYIAKLRKIDSKEIGRRIKEMVSTCGLGDVMGRPIGQLSKGFRQRVGLAAAMIHYPPILILDEPTSGLDPNQIAEIRDLIKEIGRERTVVLSTHIMQEVEATCSRALIISGGRLVGQGSIADLMRKSKSQVNYTVGLKAPRANIERELSKLNGLIIGEWLSDASNERQRFSLSGDGQTDRAEDIFKWAVGCNFILTELGRETATMEEVFKELTQNP